MPVLVGLWTLTGLVWVLSVMGMFSIGIFVLPVAIALLVTSTILTARRPHNWPSVAGLGLALAVGMTWLGWVLATSGPSEISCSGGSNAPLTCTSNGLPIDPNAVEWGVVAPWFGAAIVVAVSTVAAFYLAAMRTRSSAAMPGR